MIYTEHKAKVVAAVWGAEFIQFLATLAILPRMILTNSLNSSFYLKSAWLPFILLFKSPSAKQLARQGNE